MCEKCEQREHEEEILKSQHKLGCTKCSSGVCSLEHTALPKPEEATMNANRIVEDAEAEMKRIDEDMKKQHQEIIKGYDKQLGDCLMDTARFITKMLIMYDDYCKKGDQEECIKVLEAIRNYTLLSTTSMSTAHTTIEMLIGKVRNSG